MNIPINKILMDETWEKYHFKKNDKKKTQLGLIY